MKKELLFLNKEDSTLSGAAHMKYDLYHIQVFFKLTETQKQKDAQFKKEMKKI